ncbi:ROK family protein [Geosporobacter ferrireducens]|uniref:Uncharacterized protein n=1 Tax=Geosporobacter ferrireducens TaxID=1424294 RepID=A0A1D8GNU1_9FIRM|nr:ROK family protein [Geosporobacter ferrireducens]AOT72611.1 hypothetical protein Gferi_25490 [Geosporobacter ferrireducens]MTI55013.1 ROK family transcriptional regulator [Geosporobacter ferrireducens]
MEKKAGNPKTIRENNQKVLAHYLFEHSPTAISELSRIFKLSLPSIYKNISQLIDHNIIKETGEGDSLGGRRPMLFSFNYDLGYIASVDLKGEYLRLALANLGLKIIAREDINMRDFKNGNDLINKGIESLKTLMKANSIAQEKLFSIAVGFPGSINNITGQTYMLPVWLDIWEGVNIKRLINEEFPAVNVIVKNDMNLAAIGEMRYGVGRGYKNLIYVSLDMGVGAGIIIDGCLYEGSRFASGEIAFFKTNMGSNTTLEDEISIRGITNRIVRDMEKNIENRLERFLINNKRILNFAEVKKAVIEKDPYILGVMKDVSERLGFVLYNISVFLDNELIIISSKTIDMGYDIKKDLDEIIKKNTLIEVKTEYASLNQDEVIYGGFALSLDHILDKIITY